MSTARLLLDEMLSGAIAEQVRARGLDVLAVVDDPALVGTPDEELLAHAAAERRTIVTANIVDFIVIAREWRAGARAHHGVVYVAHRSFPPDRSFVGAMVESLAAWCEADAEAIPDESFLARTR